MSQILIDSIALESQLLSGWSSTAVARSQAQKYLWDGLVSGDTSDFIPHLEQNEISPYNIAAAEIQRCPAYTHEQRQAVLNCIEKYWGQSHVVIPKQTIMPFSLFAQGMRTPQMQFEIRCIPAGISRRDYDLYFTLGLGAYPMAVPIDNKEGRENELERIELVLRLPSAYPEEGFRELKDHSVQGGWPLLLIRSLALSVLHSHQYYGQRKQACLLPAKYLTYYQSFTAAPSFSPWPDLAGCLLIEPNEFDLRALICKLPHQSYQVVRFLGVLPLYSEELRYIDVIEHPAKNGMSHHGAGDPNSSMDGTNISSSSMNETSISSSSMEETSIRSSGNSEASKNGGRALMRLFKLSGFAPWVSSIDRPHYVLQSEQKEQQ